MILNRRSLILGAAALLAAPAVVRAESLMKIAAPRMTLDEWVAALKKAHYEAWSDSIVFGMGAIEYPHGGVPRSINPDRIFLEGGDVDIIHAIEYDYTGPFDGRMGRIDWNPPVPPLARKVVGEDWPFKTIKLRT